MLRPKSVSKYCGGRSGCEYVDNRMRSRDQEPDTGDTGDPNDRGHSQHPTAYLIMCGLENFLRIAISSTTFSLCSFFLVLMCLAAYILLLSLSWTWNTTPNLPRPSSFFSSYCWKYTSPPSSFSILACFFSSFISKTSLTIQSLDN